MGPGDLHEILGGWLPARDRRVLLDASHADDAGAVRLDGGRALLHTVDLITPIVDDPERFGQIAAANAVSDIYAMGGRPTSAVSILALPKALPPEVVRGMLGAARNLLETNGAFLVGGHTVKDAELKLGFAVTGECEARRMCTHGGARPGDALVLTKALGTGLLHARAREGGLSAEEEASWMASMADTNAEAAETLRTLGVRCATDVTGFGLAGHALNLARASDVDVVVDGSRLPRLPGVDAQLEDHAGPVGPARLNLEGCGPDLKLGRTGAALAALVCDPQTSGGLLFTLPRRKLRRLGQGVVIGEIRERKTRRAAVRVVRRLDGGHPDQ